MTEHLHLNAARQLMKRVSFNELVCAITGQDEVESFWFGDVGFWAQQLENSQITFAKAESVAADARNYRELEGLVQALDNMETVASMAQLANEYVGWKPGSTQVLIRDRAPERKFWTEVGLQVKTVKETMQPLLNGWLIAGIEGMSTLRTTVTGANHGQRATRSCENCARRTSLRPSWRT